MNQIRKERIRELFIDIACDIIRNKGMKELTIAVYYRLTEFNAKRKLGWFRFAIIHGAMIWSPIILIMAFFGLSVSGTLLYEVLMMIALIISHYVLGKIMN